MRIAIIGGGVSGLYAARLLWGNHDITLFEAGDYAGGHTNTVDADLGNETVAVDTGFIVHNDRNYPLFVNLMDELGVATQDSDMSFSMSCGINGLEYCGSNLNTLFAQRRNLLNPHFISMLREILRFNDLAETLLQSPDDMNLAEFLSQNDFEGAVINDYLVPMAAAIWSSDPREILDFPAAYFGHFFNNHGLLSVNNRPQWRTVSGGSRNYVAPLIEPFKDRVMLNTPVARVTRNTSGVEVTAADNHRGNYDAVVFACHSDQALKMLGDPSADESAVLGAIPYQSNTAVLHTDTGLMPKRRRAWAAWNYHRFESDLRQVCVTYDMTRLQNLRASKRLLVSLNAEDHIDADKVLQTIEYHHPVYNQSSVAARQARNRISGANRSYYCGAYWGYGFHEDGLRSAVDAVNALESAQRKAA